MPSYLMKALISGQHAFDGTEQDNIVDVTVDRDSYLLGIQGYIEGAISVSNESYVFEVSTNPNYQGAANASVGQLLFVGDRRMISGAAGSNQQGLIFDHTFPKPIPFSAGEKIYLNGQGSNGLNGFFRAVLYFEQKGGPSATSIVHG